MSSKRQLRNFHLLFLNFFLFKYKIITLPVMQDSSHLTIILYSSVIKIVISQKTKNLIEKIIIIIIHVFQLQS
jgi:hypothetical protein